MWPLKVLTIATVAAAFAGFLLSKDAEQELVIESKESKTVMGEPVFNRIKLISEPQRDIWMMNQSHFGSFAKPEKWDRLVIIVDKTVSPKTARFYELKSGPLEWFEDLPVSSRKEYKVSCFICHANGPRSIRADDSYAASMPFSKRLTAFAWNLRIKSYGRVVAHESHAKEDLALDTPFRYGGNYENEKLSVKTCSLCHKEEGFLARGALTRLNAVTISHMVESGAMPPLGFRMDDEEKVALASFLNGF